MGSKQYKTILTLCMIHQHPRVLLGMKKRGFGAGKWNGFGGHVEKGETIEEAARREVREEAGVEVGEMLKHGIIEFEFQGNLELLEVHIFRTTEFRGEPVESDEMRPQWYHLDEIPSLPMWADDKYWLPLLLEEKKFKAKFWFDTGNAIVKHELEEVAEL